MITEKRRRGNMGEDFAAEYLEGKGYEIIERNFNTRLGEIDIIAKRGNTMVFIEVKRRKTIECAWGAITRSQIARLRRAAETYISRTGWHGNARFDVIIICGFRLRHIKNAI